MMLKTMLATGLAAAAGFGTFEDPPAKMTYSGAEVIAPRVSKRIESINPY